ncbi:hypothetical protein BG006_009974 [Podila minutissima]|uniref:DUF2278 family protein n=1 Tax=Podila minutissima TaxID=64525 RepID=A0A9P5VJ18_9FUNG|nr:hypothetical protein BG006_009974 [Podila minutissima]
MRMETIEQDPRSPHIHIFFTHDKDATSGKYYGAAINVKSRSEDSRLIFWHKENFQDPIVTSDLKRLHQQKFYRLPSNTFSSLKGLDYIRMEDLIPNFPEGGTILDHDVTGRHNDMLDKMRPILDRAIQNRATVYLFGSQYDNASGLHNVHMNQGGLPRYSNGVNQDGAILIQFKRHWEAVFLAFGSQRFPTDKDTGLSLELSTSLAVKLGEEPTASEVQLA